MAELNITIPNNLFARLKADAATRATSVDAVVHALLEGHLTRAECALPSNYEIMLQAVLGQMSVDAAVRQQHLESEDDLCILLTYVGLPRPRVSQHEEARMRERLDIVAVRMR